MVNECSSTNGCVQCYESLLWDALDIPPCPMPRKTVKKMKHNYYYPTRLQNPLITSEVAVGFIHC